MGLEDISLNEKLTPEVKTMFVIAANPALTCANSKIVEKALRKLNFLAVLAVADIFMTPTAEPADIVLPACTFLEKTRYVVYSTHADHWWNAPSRITLSPKGCGADGTDCIDPRVVHLCYGYKESNANILTDNGAFDPITGSTGLKSLLCRVEKA